ncbi:MAG: hypothetical protein K2X91_05105, partial [Thermoleophilia bacterium]|nr:hypothetical protein [Thermoleophilia bacterium]
MGREAARRAMVEAVRGGESQRSVARRFGASLLTVQRWLTRAANEAIETIDWSDRSSAPHRQARQIPTEVEDLIVESRRRLRDESVLGEYGAAAVWRDLAGRGALGQGIPSVRTIGRTFARRGTLDAGRRVRRPAPPPGSPARLVSARAGERVGRARLVRHDRGPPTQGRPGYRDLDRHLDPRRAAGRLAGQAVHRADGRGRVDRALAHARPARLCPVRQRPDLPRHPRLPRPGRPGQPAVSGSRRRAGLRAALRARLPGRHREPQWPLAGQAVAPHLQRDPRCSQAPVGAL